MNEVVQLLKEKEGVKDVITNCNEITLVFDDGSVFSFRAEGYEGTELEVTAKVYIEKSCKIR